MAIIKKLSLDEFIAQFEKHERKDQFSPEGYEKLYALESDCRENNELDVVELCSIWSEDDTKEVLRNYDFNIGSKDEIARMSEDERAQKILTALENKTTAFLLPNGNFLYQAY